MTKIRNMKSFLFLFLLVQLSLEESTVSETNFSTSDSVIPNSTISSRFAANVSDNLQNDSTTDSEKSTEIPLPENSTWSSTPEFITETNFSDGSSNVAFAESPSSLLNVLTETTETSVNSELSIKELPKSIVTSPSVSTESTETADPLETTDSLETTQSSDSSYSTFSPDSTTPSSSLTSNNTESPGSTEPSNSTGFLENTDGYPDNHVNPTQLSGSPTASTDTTENPTTTNSPSVNPTPTELPTDPTDTRETSTATDSSSDEDPKVNVGLVVGIIITIIVVGVSVVLWRSYSSGRLVWPPKTLFTSGILDSVRPQPVSIKKFPALCNDKLDVPSKLSHEFQLLATLSEDIYATESFVTGQLPENKCKNRYVNILPFDSTRVKLAPEGDDFYSDYVNASYVKGYTNEIEYIATQGPKEETCRDFWKMVYQEPIKVIVMVTQLEEMGKPKCYRYYPSLRENMELDDIVVRCTTELHFPIYTSRTLILIKGERKRSITHLHFREWPDFGCPATPDLMLQFCQVMRHNIILAQPGITLIHCSAGVGRTGTLIAVDILLQHIKENKKIDIFGTVYKLRKHRKNMVQSEAQYVHIYKCIKEALEDPSYLSSENSSTTSLEPIYENIENIECAPLSTVSAESSKVVPDTIINENECAL